MLCDSKAVVRHADAAPFEVPLSNGDIVVVDIDGERWFKVWMRQGPRITLHFANPRYPNFKFPPGAEIKIWGVVSDSVCAKRRCE